MGRINQETEMYEQIHKRQLSIDRLIGSTIHTTDVTLEKELKECGYITHSRKYSRYLSIYIEKRED